MSRIKIKNSIIRIPDSPSARMRLQGSEFTANDGKISLLPTYSNALRLLSEFARHEWTGEAFKYVNEIVSNIDINGDYSLPPTLATRPMKHQVIAYRRAIGKDSFALLHEMGLGKTYTALIILEQLFLQKRIDRALIICPNSLKMVWKEQVETHQMKDWRFCPPHSLSFWATEHDKRYSTVSIESLSQGGMFAELIDKMRKVDRTALILDESTSIKNHKARRTKRAIILSNQADYRYILTGAPITQGLQDFYTQYEFLDPAIIGMRSFYSFRNRYCKMGGFRGKQIVGYRQVNELMSCIVPHSHILRSEDVLNLPPQNYAQVTVEPTQEQRSIYNTIMSGSFGGRPVDNMLERITLLSQLSAGLMPRTRAHLSPNPKLNALRDILESLDDKVIIWTQFRAEIDAIAELAVKMKIPHVEFHGGIPEDERRGIVDQFQYGDARIFITNARTGGKGLTLTGSNRSIYYSNDFSYENRLQSEYRIWRKGQKLPVFYTDLIVNLPIDKLKLKAIASKKDLADLVRNIGAENFLEELKL